jgi:hypothetical protein
MEAPEDRDRVRPLPPEGHSGATQRAPNVRALLPLLAGGAILLAFIMVIASGGVDPSQSVGGSPETTTTTRDFFREVETTTTIAVPTTIVTRDDPMLGEVLPEFEDGLSVIVEDDSGRASVARWRLNRRFPRFIDLPEGSTTGALDASGTLVATVGTGIVGPNRGLLSVGLAASGPQPVFVEAYSFHWHDSTLGLLAMVGRLPDSDTPGLYLILFDDQGHATRVERVRDAGFTWKVRGFHGDRIAIGENELGTVSPTVRIIDTTGAEIATARGVVNLSSAAALVGVGETDRGFTRRAWNWSLEDPDETLRYIESELPETVSPNGRHGATVVRASTSTVTVRSNDFAVPRSIGVTALLTDILFFTDDHIAAFSEQAGKLFVIEWRTGITQEFLLDGRGIQDVAAPGYPSQTN